MKEFDQQMVLATEMTRILADAGRYDREMVRTPENALQVLRDRAPFECSAKYGDLDRCATEALALQMFFSIFWGELLDIHCNGGGEVADCDIRTHHCTDAACCGPMPVWRDEAFEHEHSH